MSDESDQTLEGYLGWVEASRVTTLLLRPRGLEERPVRLYPPPGEVPSWYLDVAASLQKNEGRPVRVTGVVRPSEEYAPGVKGLSAIEVSQFAFLEGERLPRPNQRADLRAEIAAIAEKARKVREQRGRSGHFEFFSQEAPIAAFVAIGRSLLDDPKAQRADLERCREADPSWTLSVLQRCLMDPDDDVRLVAIRGLGVSIDAHGWGGMSSFPTLIAREHVAVLLDHLASERVHRFTLLLHLEGLLRNGAPRKAYESRLELIRGALSDPEPSAREAAIRLIGDLGGDAAMTAIPDLLARLDAEDRGEQTAAETSLSKITGHRFWFGGSSRKKWSKWLARQGISVEYGV